MTRIGATILDAEGLHLTEEERAFFREVRPFGFILFSRNIDTADQVRALVNEMREAAGHDAIVTIDQEGGRVQRLVPPLARQWLSPMEHVAAASDPARAIWLRYRLIADELAGLGIDSNCAPLADVAVEGTHPFLKNRCFGSDPEQVVTLARACADGLLAGGILPVIKHIPGHGRAVADSHHDLPHVDASSDELDGTDFAPFRALNDLPMAMTAHVVYDALSPEPATLSHEVVEVIRNRIGYSGLVMTDDLSMKALSGAVADRTRASLAAGCDIALFCNGSLLERQEVAEAAGMLSGAALNRANAVFAARRAPDDLDIAAAEAELDRLMGGRVYG